MLAELVPVLTLLNTILLLLLVIVFFVRYPRA